MSRGAQRLGVLSLVLSVLLGGMGDAAARSPWKIGRDSLTTAVLHSAVQKRVLDIVGDSDSAMKGLIKMAKLGAKEGQTNKDIIVSVGKAIQKLEKEVGRAKARRFLEDFDEVAEWARRQPQVRRVELQRLVQDFTKTRSKTFTGAWYEMHLAAHFIKNPPPRLVRMQPSLPGDKRLFRDFVVRQPNGKLAYVEAKNWRHIWNKSARKKLRRQIRSHFRRMRRPPPEPVLSVPPGKELIFYFNRRADGRSVHASWIEDIQREARRELRKPPPKGYGFSAENARRWVREHLHFEEVDLIRAQ